nr:MAG TPA: hypothetical protein [Bacteriophage sp.]
MVYYIPLFADYKESKINGKKSAVCQAEKRPFSGNFEKIEKTAIFSRV